jgi:hypothetical protein
MSAPLVHVEWKDHCMLGNWADDVDAFHSPARVHTVGWILKEDDEGLTIAQSINGGDDDPNRNPGNLIYLLKSCIVKRTVLECPK